MVEVGIARRVSHAIPATPSADAVVLLHGSATGRRIDAATHALLPGGLLYCEVDRRQVGSITTTPASLKASLRARGVTPTGIYWPVPHFATSKRYIPIDAAGALRWYTMILHTSKTRWHRLLKATFRKLTHDYSSDHAARLLPWYAITAVASRDALADWSIRHDDLLPVKLHERDLRPFLLTSGQDDGSRVVMIPFGPCDDNPVAVIKVARLPELNTNIEGEQRTLAELRGLLEEPVRSSIPEPLGLSYFGNLAVGVESCAVGQSLFDANIRWDAATCEKIDNVRLATRWLIQFHTQTRISPTESRSVDLVSRAGSIFERYCHGFDATQMEQHLFAQVLERLQMLEDQPLPFVWQHNDYGPWNIYRRGNDISVIDWEIGWGPGFESVGPPLCDLVYLTTHWSYSARRLFTPTQELRGFHQLFLSPGSGGELVDAARDCITEYLAALEIDRRYLPALLVYTWAERAVNRLDRRRLLQSLGESPRTGDQFAAYVHHLAGWFLESSTLNRFETVFGR